MCYVNVAVVIDGNARLVADLGDDNLDGFVVVNGSAGIFQLFFSV